MFFSACIRKLGYLFMWELKQTSSNSCAQSARGLRGRKKSRGDKKGKCLPSCLPSSSTSSSSSSSSSSVCGGARLAPKQRREEEEEKTVFIRPGGRGFREKKEAKLQSLFFFLATSIATRLWQNTVLRFFYRNFTGGIAHSWGERKSTFAIRFFSPPSYILTKCGGLFWVLGFGVFFRSGDQPVFSAVTTKPNAFFFPDRVERKNIFFVVFFFLRS